MMDEACRMRRLRGTTGKQIRCELLEGLEEYILSVHKETTPTYRKRLEDDNGPRSRPSELSMDTARTKGLWIPNFSKLWHATYRVKMDVSYRHLIGHKTFNPGMWRTAGVSSSGCPDHVMNRGARPAQTPASYLYTSWHSIFCSESHPSLLMSPEDGFSLGRAQRLLLIE